MSTPPGLASARTPARAAWASLLSWLGVGAVTVGAVVPVVALSATHRTPRALPTIHALPAKLGVPAGVPTPVTMTQGTVPPNNPPQNIAPNPNFLNECTGTQYDNSPSCVQAVLQAIANARATEGLPGMSLPSSWNSLSPAEQLYVATNLERAARGLPILSGMATALDQAAMSGAQQSQDPRPPSGFPWSSWGSNWAGAVGNPLEAIYYWMYDDGEGSGNIDCTPSNSSGCWGHRDNVLMPLKCQPCVMGTALDPTGYQGYPSWAELLVDTSGSPQLDVSWSQIYGGAPSGGSDPAPPAAPAIVLESNGAPSVFVEQPDHSLVNYWYMPQSGTWGAATIAGPGSTYSAPVAVMESNGAPSVFVEGPSNSLTNYWYVPSQGSYSGATIAGPGSTFSAPTAVLESNGAPSVFVEGPSNSLTNYWFVPSQGTYSGVTVAGPGSTYSSASAVLESNGAPSVFVAGPQSSLTNYWYVPSQGAFSGVMVAGAGSVMSAPSAVLEPNGTPTVFVAGPQNSVTNYWYVPSLGAFSGAMVAGPGSASSAPVVAMEPNGAPTLFVAGPENSLTNFWYDPSTGAFDGLMVEGPGSTYSGPGVVLQSNAAPTVFVTRPTLNYWYASSSQSWDGVKLSN